MSRGLKPDFAAVLNAQAEAWAYLSNNRMETKCGSAEARGELRVLLDHALFKDGLVGIGLFVANLNPLIFELTDKVVGVGFLCEFVNVFSGAVFLNEVGILQRSEEAGCLGGGGYLAAEDDALDRWPGLGDGFAAALLPSAPVDSAPGGGKIDSITNYEHPEARIMRCHGWYGITLRRSLRAPLCALS